MARRELKIVDGYALFWGQWPSNWERSPFTLDGVAYNCVEQYMMAEKARMFGDTRALAKIMASPDPADQKRFGREVLDYDEPQWAKARYDVVLRATLAKYRQNKHLRELLLATGDLVFVEASPEDRVWGIGMKADHPHAANPARWHGQNLLGKAVTEARDILKAEAALR